MADIDIHHISSAKISRADIEKQFAGDKRLDKILLIFDKLNAFDKKEGDTLSSLDITNMQGLTIYHNKNKEDYTHASLDNNHDDKITDYELNLYFSQAKEFYGDEIEIEDFRKFLGFVASKGDAAYSKRLEEASNNLGMSKELIQRLGGPSFAEEYKQIERNGQICYERTIDGYTELRDQNGKLLERRETASSIIGYEGCEEINTYNEKGETSTTYINHKTGEQTKFQYAQNPEEKSYKMHIKDGVATKQSLIDEKNSQLENIVFNAGRPDSTSVAFKYDENNQLTGIDIKDNSLEEDKPRGFITDGDIYLTHVPKKTTVDNATVEALKQMIDGGARYGEDFDLKIEDGKLKIVPKIKNETGKETPELKGAAMEKYKDLVGKGIHATEDFDVEYDKDGNFRYHLKNNQAKGYDADYRSEVYDKDGNFVSSLTVKGGEIIRETMVNGQKQTTKMPFDEAFMQLLTEKNFAVAGEILGKDDVLSGGYNIYPAAEKYKELTGRELIGDVYDAIHTVGQDDKNMDGVYNLMAKLQPHWPGFGDTKEDFIKNYYDGYNQFKEVLNFDPKNSPIADMLPKISRTQTGSNSYTETVNNDSFAVQFNNGQITVSKNGATAKSIDISHLPDNYVKNVLSQVPSVVLYDIASSGTKLTLNDSMNDNSMGGTTNGYYMPADGGGIIVLDPNALIGERAVKTIVHEAGHMCDHIDDKDNAIKAIKEQLKSPTADFGRDKPLTVQELLDNQGTFQGVSPADEKLHELFDKEYANYRKNPPQVNSNATYATESPMEFFAESYALLNMGTCKSEYVIANYFPETLARVKEIMEANRAHREQ